MEPHIGVPPSRHSVPDARRICQCRSVNAEQSRRRGSSRNISSLTGLTTWSPWGCPMPNIAQALIADADRMLTVAERWLGPADKLDYAVRRWLIPVPFESRARSMPRKEASIQSSGALSDAQVTIGRHSTPLSHPYPRGSPIFSENLSNEMISAKHGLEAVMLLE